MAPSPLGRVLGILLAALVAGAIGACSRDPQRWPTVHVFKSATCGCCSKWIEHLERAGFEVEAEDREDLPDLKRAKQVPGELESCHTAVVDGYVVEGHVPAGDIERLLTERPKITGLAVPDMPLGSPGMEHPDPTRHVAFDVLAFGTTGTSVFARHPAASADASALD